VASREEVYSSKGSDGGKFEEHRKSYKEKSGGGRSDTMKHFFN